MSSPKEERDWERNVAASSQLIKQGRYTEVESILLDAIARADKARVQSPLLATALNNLGLIYQDLGKAVKAEGLYLRAARIWQQLGEGYQEELVICSNNLASLYLETEQYGKADAVVRRTERHAVPLEQNQLERAWLANIRGRLYYVRGKYAAAEPLLRQALADFEASLGPEAPQVAAALSNLGALCFLTARRPEARTLFERALAIFEKQLTPDVPRHVKALAKVLTNLSVVDGFESRWDESTRYFNRALPLAERTFGPDHPLVAEILWDHATMLRQMGRKGEAKPEEKRAREIITLWTAENPLHHTVDIAELSPH